MTTSCDMSIVYESKGCQGSGNLDMWLPTRLHDVTTCCLLSLGLIFLIIAGNILVHTKWIHLRSELQTTLTLLTGRQLQGSNTF